MKAVFLDFATLGKEPLDLAPLRAATPDLTLLDRTADAAVAGRIRGCDLVYLNKARMSRRVIETSPGLRFIGLVATGVDNVDVEAARAHGIAVCNVRNYCTNSVADHVFAALLQLARSSHRYQRSTREGRWQRADSFCYIDYPLRELSTMTLGVVGHGALGAEVARRAAAFGMRVLLARRRGQPAVAGDGRTDFDTLLATADAISLHCPLNDDTRGLVGAAELARMKPGALLINTARGGLVDTGALVEALAAGHVSAAIDVLATEPPVAGDPLLDYAGDNLLLTPHVAWAGIAARQAAIDELAANVVAFMGGERRNRVD